MAAFRVMMAALNRSRVATVNDSRAFTFTEIINGSHDNCEGIYALASQRRRSQWQYLAAAKCRHTPAFDDCDLACELLHLGGVMADVNHGDSGFVAQANEIGKDFFLALI